jgi:hypothetical protein
VLAEEDIEDDAVYLVVESVIGNDTNLGARLAITIDTAFALLVTSWIPA